jgi:hypothetical protein
MIKYKQHACMKVIDGAYDADYKAPTNKELASLPDDRAFINVYEVWPNQLMTGPRFGCIHWVHNDDGTT